MEPPALIHPARRDAPLHAEFPETARLPFLPLLHGPTPLEPVRGLEAYFGRGDILVKRDDASSPVYGGNKVRKYEYLLGEARARGARHLVTMGGVASTQVTATAVLGRALGFRVSAVLFDQPMTRFGRRGLLADQAAGAELSAAGSYPGALLGALSVQRAHPGSFFVLPGASTPLPNLGYIDAALELAAQLATSGAPRPAAIVVPAGSCGTVAGLALGLAYLGWETDVVGVRITTRAVCNAPFVWLVESATRRYLRGLSPRYRRAPPRPTRSRLFHGAAGPGYGEPTPEAIEGAELYAAISGHPGEITYTGKALVALRALARSGEYAHGSIVLWNTLTGSPPSIEGAEPNKLPAALRRALEAPVVA